MLPVTHVVNKPADAQGVWAYARSDYGSGVFS